DGGPEAGGERIFEAEGGGPALAIREHVGDEKGRRRRGGGAHAPLPRARSHPQRAPGPPRGERAIRTDELPEAHVGRAERERRAVQVGAAVDAVEAHAPELADEAVPSAGPGGAHRGP